MKALFPVLLSALLTLAPAPSAAAGAGSFTLVNGTGAAIAELSIRRFGTQQWQGLGAAPAPGARAAIRFSDPDCAFDIRATLAGGGTAIWTGVNLCEVNAVILRRNGSGETWADYE